MEIKVASLIEGEVIDFTHEGKGVLRKDSQVVFVDGGLIGDKVRAEITEIRKNYSLGLVKEVLQPSPYRVDWDFPIEDSRGSVPLINYSYEKQLEWKREKTIKDFQKIAALGLNQIPIRDIVGMEDNLRYRNHSQFALGEKGGRPVIGFYQLNSKDIVDMKRSILHSHVGDRIIEIIREWMEEYKIQTYNKENNKDGLRYIGLRFNRDMEVMLILVTGGRRLVKKEELIEALTREKVVSIYQNINDSPGPYSYGKEYIKIYGKDKLVDHIGDFTFHLSPSSFIQINRLMAKALYDKAIDYLDLKKNDIVFDIYSGIGSISIYMSKKVKKVYGIEINKDAVRDARENARLNGLENLEFIVGRAEDLLDELYKKYGRVNKFIIDPPRGGCHKDLLESLAKINLEKLLYISCNPSTMARDIKFLMENGYKLRELKNFDLFPHTASIETIGLLEK